jgi:hypothetical protein
MELCHHVEIDVSEFIPWHMSLFSHNDSLYAIVACVKRGTTSRCFQMLGEFSEDLSKLKIFKQPLTDYNSYRGSGYVSTDNIFHLYTTTVHEKIIGGTSIDGREILYAQMPFEDLITKLKNL